MFTRPLATIKTNTRNSDAIRSTKFIYEDNSKENNPSTRSDSIGSYEAFRDLQEPTSVDLLRNSIFRSITNKRTPTKVVDIRERHRSTTRHKLDFTDITQADIDVKFLKKRCSSFESSTKTTNVEEIPQHQTSVPVSVLIDSGETNSLSDVSELVESNSFETSEELSDGKEILEESGTERIDESLTGSQKFTGSNQNSLRLAFSIGSNHSIFENCSTYDITCSHEVNLVSKVEGQPKQDDLSTPVSSENSSLGQEMNDLRNSFVFLSKEIEDSFSNKSVPSVSSPDDQNALCDTFFPHVINGEYVPPQSNASSQHNNVNKKRSVVDSDLKKEKISLNDEDNVSTYSNESQNGRKPSRRIRKRIRKSLSKGPYVYDCPKCGVSYVMSTKTMSDVACCLYCDLCTSVEPVFMKREKLTWNTCRIC